MTDVGKMYDERVEEFQKQFGTNVMKPDMDKFVALLNGNRVLDVGCGSGNQTKYLVENNLDTTGIDLSDKMLEEARKRVPEAKFLKMNLLDMEFDDNSFDGIWMCACLLFVKPVDIGRTFEQFRRVLKQDGILFIATKEGQGQYTKNNVVHYSYTKEEVENYLKDNDFEIIESKIEKDYWGRETKWVEIIAKKL
ncbi:MAG: class I SAM-dependent methyltransferase [Candidatus Aenigmarchaeota archaeon]|nr:class I SAM-dependent methyltransferase [Candidatus Aenigmarchaeota archaeon]